jgi:hypothetical protein
MPFRHTCFICKRKVENDSTERLYCKHDVGEVPMQRRTVKERVPKLGEIGICAKCGKGVSKGEFVEGRLYGSECIKTVYRGGSDE